MNEACEVSPATSFIADWLKKHTRIGGALAFVVFAQLIGVMGGLGAVESVTVNSASCAAEKGDAATQFRYAEMLRTGNGVASNLTEAAEWTLKAEIRRYRAAKFPSAGLVFWYNATVQAERKQARTAVTKQNPRAGRAKNSSLERGHGLRHVKA